LAIAQLTPQHSSPISYHIVKQMFVVILELL